MTVLVTGGSGFIGSNVCELLARRGKKALSADLRPFRFSGKVANNILVKIGDITRFESLLELAKGRKFEGIIHIGALVGSVRVARVPLKALEVNVLGTANVLETARVTGVERIIYVGSHSIYGNRPDLLPIKEDDRLNPDTAYRHTKLMGEQVCAVYRQCYDLKIIVVRPSLVFGPRLPWPNTLSFLLYHALMNKKVKIRTGPDDKIDYVYVKDVAKGIVSACLAGKPSHSVYNLGSGSSLSPLEIASAIKEIVHGFGFDIGSGYSAESGGWVQGPLDITRAAMDLSYKPTPLKDALKEYVSWLRSHPEELRRHRHL